MVAAGCISGVPVERLVYGALVERELWVRVTRRASELQVKMMKDQAILNANAIVLSQRRSGG